MKTTPKDFFLHLGATIALYASMVAIINLAYSIADFIFKDSLTSYTYAGNIAWPISMLVVLVPVLYVLEYTIARDIAKEAGKQEIWIWRWRIYLALFVSGALIIGDLIALINTYINGEISSRFVAKVAIILVISVIVFAYYIFQRMAGKALYARKISWLGIILVIAAIVGGFIIVGSPTKQRSLRFDSERISDLNNIQYQVVQYWQSKGHLPASLDDVADPISGNYIPSDPRTGKPYAYTAEAEKVFKLCAVFDLATPTDESGAVLPGDYAYFNYGSNGNNWKHPEGEYCFERTVDPDRFPVAPKK